MQRSSVSLQAAWCCGLFSPACVQGSSAGCRGAPVCPCFSKSVMGTALPQKRPSTVVSKVRTSWSKASLSLILTSNLKLTKASNHFQETWDSADHTDLSFSSLGTHGEQPFTSTQMKGNWVSLVRWLLLMFPWRGVQTMNPDSIVPYTWSVLSEWGEIFWWMKMQIKIDSDTLQRNEQFQMDDII